ncbi:MAG: M48 family peptidase [Cupriavidus sp.]|jgi:predicted metal-dependent hydrolase|uniref:M48 family metallopeptidase n=1 Tax=Cupriavidus pauculus TaxID=82633 RepID=UPI000780DD32|nr:SprT family zinc-dependent metalloprotease [Cupriavidus pauculus]MBU64158.1 M48 family peptidase [Cupriavidus sp.]MBY4732501.1 M48 family metallopeptidase [Cupriavidus pauculus]
MKLLRPTADPNAQLELPLAEPAPAAPAPQNLLAPQADPAAPSADVWPPALPNGRMLQIGERTLHYALKRSSRRTIGFTVDDRGLSITAPRWVTLADVEAAIVEKQRWIFAKLGEWRHREARRVLPTVQWRDGATLPFLGKPITLQLDSPVGALLFQADTRVLHLALPGHADEQQIKDRVQGWLQHQARRLLSERLELYASKLGVRHTGFALTSAATRWGSCTADGKIRLNWRLMHFPLSMIDYVAAHELAHLKEMNHGPRFWETVESIFPEFRDARAQLRAHPPELLPTF